MKRTILNLFKNKLNKVPSIGITSYDYPTSRIINNCNVDFIVVGDTAGSTVHGIQNLNAVTMDMMLMHCESVKRGSQNQFLIGDMPHMSYQPSNEVAIKNAGDFVKIGMDAVKVEGNFPDRIKSIADSGTVVMGHLGLTPQSIYKFGTYTVRAKEEEEANKLIEDAKLLEEAGCYAIVLEKIPSKLAKKVAENLNIPVIGIGAGANVDGQVLVLHDMLGMNHEFNPRFLRRYLNLYDEITAGVKQYISDVKKVNFPNQDEQY